MIRPKSISVFAQRAGAHLTRTLFVRSKRHTFSLSDTETTTHKTTRANTCEKHIRCVCIRLSHRSKVQHMAKGAHGERERETAETVYNTILLYTRKTDLGI